MFFTSVSTASLVKCNIVSPTLTTNFFFIFVTSIIAVIDSVAQYR